MGGKESRAGFVRMHGVSSSVLLALVVVALGLAVGSWKLLADGQPESVHAAVDGPDGGAPPETRDFKYADEAGDVLFRIDHGAAVPMTASAAASTRDGGSVPIRISRHAALAAARGGAMDVVLPDGERYPVRYERSENSPGGNWTFIGRVDTAVGDLAAVITFGRDGVFGLLPTPDGGMMQVTTREGQAFLRPAGGIVPPGMDPARHPDYLVPPVSARKQGVGAQANAPSSSAGGARSQAALTIGQAAADGEVSIDVLATYTANLVALRGSASAAETEFQNLVAVANQAHIDSGSRVRLRIADFVQIDYPAEATNRDVLYTITDGNLPDGTDIRALRDAAAADLVAVIRPYAEGDTTCGIAWLPGPDLQAYALDDANGYSVTAVEDCGPLVLAHELGHNLGLMHDRETVIEQYGGTLGYGAFPFSFGYRQNGPPAFATVMAYDVGEQVWINRFSHPGSALCEGVACGIAEASDNVRSLNLTGDTISRFRDPLHTISILDGRVLEGDQGMRNFQFVVRSSSPAPEGGVSFDVVVMGGTATQGVDWHVAPWNSEQGLIAAGSSQARFAIEVPPDVIVEGDETIEVRLENVQGMAVHDAVAVGTIQDDDPRVTVSGSFRFPPGIPAPTAGDVSLNAETEGLGGLFDNGSAELHPDFGYEVQVPKGGNVELYAGLPDPFLLAPERVVSVRESMTDVDLEVEVGVNFSGTLKFDGCKLGCGGVPVILWNPYGDGYGYYVNYQSSGNFWGYYDTYDRLVMTGVPMQLEVRDTPAPYVRQLVEVPPMRTHETWNIELRDVPSLTIAHAAIVEGTSGNAFNYMTMVAELSVPAPPGGVVFDITPGGTAGPDDFVLSTRTFHIPEGQTTVPITVIIRGDDVGEPDETLELQVTGIQGAAWSPGPGTIRIVTDESHAVGGGKCTGSAEPPAVRMCH